MATYLPQERQLPGDISAPALKQPRMATDPIWSWNQLAGYDTYDLHLRYGSFKRSSSYFYVDVKKVYLRLIKDATPQNLAFFLQSHFDTQVVEHEVKIPETVIELSLRKEETSNTHWIKGKPLTPGCLQKWLMDQDLLFVRITSELTKQQYNSYVKLKMDEERKCISVRDLEEVHPTISLPNHAWMKMKLMYESAEISDISIIPPEIMKYVQHAPNQEILVGNVTYSDIIVQHANQLIAQVEESVRKFRSSLMEQMSADLSLFIASIKASPPCPTTLNDGARRNFDAAPDAENSHLKQLN
ncbi:hypothetical protein GEMRC1_010259 [Eukaryota sp. GEM-RC1]